MNPIAMAPAPMQAPHSLARLQTYECVRQLKIKEGVELHKRLLELGYLALAVRSMECCIAKWKDRPEKKEELWGILSVLGRIYKIDAAVARIAGNVSSREAMHQVGVAMLRLKPGAAQGRHFLAC